MGMAIQANFHGPFTMANEFTEQSSGQCYGS